MERIADQNLEPPAGIDLTDAREYFDDKELACKLPIPHVPKIHTKVRLPDMDLYPSHDITKQSFTKQKEIDQEKVEEWLKEHFFDLVMNGGYWKRKWDEIVDEWEADGYPDLPEYLGGYD